MAKNTKTVRMFDGAEWAVYKVGGKKHQAAEARRAEFDASKATAKSLNLDIAAFLRGHQIVPSGKAWAEVKAAVTEASDLDLLTEKNLDRLRKLNAKDGLEFKVPAEKPAKAKKAKTEVTATEKPRKGKKAARKARSAAAKKGWDTRRANAAKAAEVEVKAPKKAKADKGTKATKPGTKKHFFAVLSEDGAFTEAEIKALWAKRGTVKVGA